MHLDIQVGEHANDYKQIMERDKLSELQLRIRQLLDQVEQISKEQNYQRVSSACSRCRVAIRISLNVHVCLLVPPFNWASCEDFRGSIQVYGWICRVPCNPCSCLAQLLFCCDPHAEASLVFSFLSLVFGLHENSKVAF